jgi:broad specificity phosphatase PhoE
MCIIRLALQLVISCLRRAAHATVKSMEVVAAEGPSAIIGGVRLLLVRHGQTPSNVLHLLDTDVPGPGLSEIGQQQALALVDTLAREKVGAIIASTLIRTQQTAAPLAADRNLEVLIRAGIREIPAGALEGPATDASTAIYRDTMFAWAAGAHAVQMPGSPRDGAQLLAEFDAVVEEAEGLVGDGTAVLVSHGGVIRVWASSRSVNLPASYVREQSLANTGIIVMTGSSATNWVAQLWESAPASAGEERADTDPAAGVR